MRLERALWLLPAFALSCTGLHLENGNAYPCDYSLGAGARDEACQLGDVCGTNNVCQPFIYEGPRFEGQATLPEYGTESGEGALVHPLALNTPAIEVLADLPLSRLSTSYFRSDAGIAMVRSGHLSTLSPMLPTQLPIGFSSVVAVQPFFYGSIPLNVLFESDNGQLAVGRIGSPGTDRVQAGGLPFVATGYRVIEIPPEPWPDAGRDLDAGFRAAPVAWNATDLGIVARFGNDWRFTSWVSGAGAVLDVASLASTTRLFVFALLPDGIDVIDANDAGVSTVASLDALTVTSGRLKTDRDTRVIAAVRAGSLGPSGSTADVLSTFQVNVTADGPALTSPWPDCTPCGEDGHIEVLAPSVRTGVPAIDLVCTRALSSPRALRVVGSVALSQLDTCLTEEIDVPVSLSRVAGVPDRIVSWDTQAGLLIGGQRGELWSGDTLTTLAPEYLDRVPFDVAPALAGRIPSIAVIAGDYLAIQQTEENLGPLERLNGFRRLPPRELGASEGSSLFGFVHGVGGWAVTSEGALARVRLAMGTASAETAGDLVTASEEPIRSSIGGEGFIKSDGGLAFFLAADDSLYFVPDPVSALDPLAGESIYLPVLTPEPSVPIRSLALERTFLGTDGEDQARGYLVTSRNVYSWELSGNPARWSSTPLVLTGGEPMEVWFDSSRSALGRVGFRDGQIFSLPGGYQLAEELPAGPNGVSPQVIDFENLGGWPVAYATTGLFIAGWDQVDGKLQNRFPNGVNKPMTWREVKISGDVPTPWMRTRGGAEAGKLFVAEEPQDKDAGTQLFRLLLFNDDEVRQVAHHLRRQSK